MSNKETEELEVRGRYIPTELEQIDGKLTDLDTLLALLRERLSTVLRKDLTDDEAKVYPVANDAPQLAHDLAKFTERIQDQIQLLDDIINRIEL